MRAYVPASNNNTANRSLNKLLNMPHSTHYIDTDTNSEANTCIGAHLCADIVM